MDFEWYFSDFSRASSAAIMALIFVGLVLRRNRKLHPPIMLGCFGLDVALLLHIEFSRDAIETSFDKISPLLGVHIILALIMLAGYGFLTQTGFKILKTEDPATAAGLRKRHGIGAGIFVLTRIAVMVTAVMVALEVNA
ncbi:MAG: hypothetical protein KDB07_01960 [Planctomycetes bacterium]|nr:hypothetical protein [Planctomycetota bacterium]